MHFSALFIFNSILLGFGLAMDAFSVSLTYGLEEPAMRRGRMFEIAGTFAAFQFAMPMIGWVCVHAVVGAFSSFQALIPWIALILLTWIGGDMAIGSIMGSGNAKEEREEEEVMEEENSGTASDFAKLFLLGIATSIDALSVGFTISEYGPLMATACSLIIAVVTLIVCLGGLKIGRKFGTRLAGKADILGGCILLFIGFEIFLSNILGG